MKLQILVAAALVAPLAGCDVMVVDRRPRRYTTVVVAQPAPVVVAQPAPVVVAPPPPPPPVVVVQPAPVVVEEGAVVGGVVVLAPPAVDGYVLIGGDWYYWHPGFRCWVHAHRPYGWRPGGEVRVYHGWGEHPMYRR